MRPPNAGKGRKLGSKNKPKTFEAGLLAAVEGLGEKDYKRIVQLALAAMENEIFVESADGKSTVKKVIYNFDPLRAILPYVARKQPEAIPPKPETPEQSVEAAKATMAKLAEYSKPLEPAPPANP